jgi:outer membrane immunogenic protein
MKRILLATVAMTALGSASALAADLPQRPEPAYKAPVMVPAPVATWTGCYVGGNIGGAWANGSASGGGAEVSTTGSSFVGGGQVGCDYEFGGGFVIGARDMFDGTSGSRSGTFPAGAFGAPLGTTAVANFNNQWFDTLTARVGYAVQPTWLLYFQGGGAWAHTTSSVSYAGFQYGQTSNTRSGWTIGGGVEWMFAPHWSAFLEYNYMDFGSQSASVTGALGAVYPVSFSATESDVLIGVNYRFF